MAKTTGGSRANTAPQISGNGLSVLLISPSTDLPNADAEQQRIINALHPQVLLGEVVTSDVLDAVQQRRYDVVWFLGHSGPTGIQLSDGVLSSSHLAQILRQQPPALVVLNSCSSIYAAQQIHDDVQAAVICTVLDVPDLDAYITGAALAGALAAGLEIPDAYQRSRPSYNRQYVMLNGSILLNGDTDADDIKRLVARTAADLHGEIARTTAEMQRQLDAIRQEQARVRAEMATQVDRYQPVKGRAQLLAWLAGFVLFMLSYAVLEFRDMLSIPAPVALMFALFVATVSCWCFVWGLRFRLDK